MIVFNEPELQNAKLVENVFGALNNGNLDQLRDYFLQDVAFLDLGDKIPPFEGREVVMQFLGGFFAKAENLNFELLGAPHVAHSVVTAKHIDHFVLDGEQHHDEYVSVFFIVDNKVKKWFGHMQSL